MLHNSYSIRIWYPRVIQNDLNYIMLHKIEVSKNTNTNDTNNGKTYRGLHILRFLVYICITHIISIKILIRSTRHV